MCCSIEICLSGSHASMLHAACRLVSLHHMRRSACWALVPRIIICRQLSSSHTSRYHHDGLYVFTSKALPRYDPPASSARCYCDQAHTKKNDVKNKIRSTVHSQPSCIASSLYSKGKPIHTPCSSTCAEHRSVSHQDRHTKQHKTMRHWPTSKRHN